LGLKRSYNKPYIHERAEWPKLRWSLAELARPLAQVRHRQGLLLGRMQSLGFGLREQATLEALTEEVQRSSEIEGELLDREQVRSSLARRLGIEIGALTQADRRVEGVVEMMLDATQRYDAQLTAQRLFGWHAAMFPTGYSGRQRIRVGAWRDDSAGPMQVVSGPIGGERVHFEAPDASRVDKEMGQFLAWFEAHDNSDPVLRAALAHFWFVTIHPFDDGNGRIARAVSDMALARSEKSAQRFYSMSAQICKERRAYYEILERTQKGDLEITSWIGWFLSALERAIQGAESMLEGVLAKARFWETWSTTPLNERQRLLLNRLLDGFEGKLTTSKWAKIAKCSQDTALRDIQELVAKRILAKDEAGGRSTSYSLRKT
jgi:Fic family protein